MALPTPPDSPIGWIVLGLTTGGFGKWFYDLAFGRSGRNKTRAEGQAVLIQSASDVAESALAQARDAINELQEYRAEQATYRREQDRRWDRLDVQLRKHSEWDRQVASRLAELDEPVSPPPPLFMDE